MSVTVKSWVEMVVSIVGALVCGSAAADYLRASDWGWAAVSLIAVFFFGHMLGQSWRRL